MARFDGRQAGYIAATRRQVPGLDDLHRMTGLLLAERITEEGRVLVVGAGGGLELRALAQQHAGWSFDGVDPSSDMLALAQQTTSCHSSRIRLCQGDIHAAPKGPFDGAVCLLVFHHISPEERMATLRGIRHRLAPGSPLVLAHVSFPQREPDRSLWMERHIAFGAGAGMDRWDAARIGMMKRLFIDSPEDEQAHLHDAGFTDVAQFYQAFSFRGWIAYA